MPFSIEIPATIINGFIGAFFGALSAAISSFLIAERRNRVDLGLATWKDRAEAHRRIYAAYIRLNSFLHEPDSNSEKTEVVRDAFVTYRDHALFLDDELSDEVYKVFCLMRSYKNNLEELRGTGESQTIKGNATHIRSLKQKLRESAGVNLSASFLRRKLH